MLKILTIANREFRAIVGTKAFLISLAIMPVLMFGGLIAIQLLQQSGSIEEKTIAVIDHSDQFYDTMVVKAEENNAMIDAMVAKTSDSGAKEQPEKARRRPPSAAKGTRFKLQRIAAADATPEKLMELSNDVRNQKLTGVLEIPADVVESSSVKFYSEDSGISSMNFWITEQLNSRVKSIRFEKMGLDAGAVAQATQPISLRNLGLPQIKSDGTIQAAEEKDIMTSMMLPLFVMMLMFMVIFMSSQPMLESVIEEKSQRIAEVLLGSVNPWQLMWGKLLGSVGGSLTIVAVYAGGAYFFATQKGYADMIPLHLIPWFIVFQILGVMFYASIFMAVGASVTQLKEAQSMLMPAWILLMCPLFVWFLIIQEPNGSLGTGVSMFPPATPTTMMLRMATGATVPLYQLILGVILLILATAACVWLAGRIFRVGILWQGKTPKLTEILRWAIAG